MSSDDNKTRIPFFKWGRDSGISPDRLMAFTDGVFAIAITLLVLGLELPETTFLTASSFEAFMLSLLPFMSTINVSFIILGGFWVYHHEFVRVKRVTVPFLWMSIIYLLLIMYVPFVISVVGKYVQFAQANILFGLVMTLSSLWLLVMFYYADYTNILEDDLAFDKRYTYETISVISIIIIIVTALSYFVSSSFQIFYLLLPVFSSLRAVRHEKVKINNQRTSIEHLLKEAPKVSVKKEDKATGSLAHQFSAQSQESFKSEIEFIVRQEILRKINELGSDYHNMTRDEKSKEIADMRRNIMGYVDEAVSDELKKYT